MNGHRTILSPVLLGFLAFGVLAPAVASDGEVTETTVKQAQKKSESDGGAALDYPSLCKMAEMHRDWDAAWGFAEKWAESADPAVRAEGIRKLMELSFYRSGADSGKLTAMGAGAGLSVNDLQLYQARIALKQREFRRASLLLEKLASGSGLSREELSRVMHLQVLAKIGEKEYPAAAELAERRAGLAGDDGERFQASCYLVYALALGGKDAEAQNQLNSLIAAYPARSRELADLHLLLTALRGDWKAVRAAAAERGRNAAGSAWYLAACRAAAEHAEKQKDWKAALQWRDLALNAAVEEDDRKQAVLHLLSVQERCEAWKEMAGTLELYLTWFPGTPDRQKLQCQAARYLVKAGDVPGALKLYDAVLAAENASAANRFTAALEAAGQCGARNLVREELRYLESAVRYAPSAEDRQLACFRLGEYYERTGAFKRAQEAFLSAAEEKGPLKEKAQLFRLQSLIKSKDFTEALDVAAGLCKASAPDLRAAAHYHMASLHEKTGDLARAAAEYQDFAKRFPESDFAAPALYNAALIAENAGNAAETIRRWQAFLQFAPRHTLAPNARYKLMTAFDLAGKVEESADTAEELAKDFPESLFAAAALFRLVDQASAANRHGAALEYLARIEALPHRNPGIAARVLFDRASIHAKLDNPRKALELLEKLLGSHAADPVAADAAELAGYLSALLGEYISAAGFYVRAAQLRPGGVFASGCMERYADCLFSSAAGSDSGTADETLRKAETEYRSLLQKGRAYAPLLYKIALCREAAGDEPEAIRICTEILYRQAADRHQGVHPDRVWAPKALYAAIRLNRARRSLEGARSALRLIALARQIGLEKDGRLDVIEQELQAKYKL